MFKEYKTVGDFIVGCGDFCVENGLTSLKYGGTTDEGVYKVNEDDCGFLLPYNNDCIISGEWGQLQGMEILLSKDMNSFGKSYINTFAESRISSNLRSDEFYFGDRYISVEGMFKGAEFRNFNGEITIRDSFLEVSSMFYCSSGLNDVTFKNCLLWGFDGLLVGSGVKHVTFENCSSSCDFNDYTGSADEVFHRYMTSLTLKNCDNSLLNTIVKMFDGKEYFKDLEINIID